MTFKFRNLKKIIEDITIIEEDEEEDEELYENQENNLQKKLSKESSGSNPKTKNSDQFKANNMNIALDPKLKDYIAFLLDNQIKLDNMEMVIDIKLSETVFNSFYEKLTSISSSLNNLYLDFTENKKNEGPFANAKDRIPLCEDRIMFIKCDFIFNHLLIDIFLKEEKENKDWMRLLLLIDNFEFIFNEIGIFLNFTKNYVFILKDFSYINDMKNIKEENLFDIDEKINDIYKEDSYMKRLGYIELFYNDKMNLNKMEKEMNFDLGNINLFFCKDSYNFVIDFYSQFSSNYLDKIKNIFSKKEENEEDNDDEEEEEKVEKEKEELEEIKNINNEINKNEKEEIKLDNKNGNKNEDFNDFEILDDFIITDDSDKNKEKTLKNKKDQKKIENKYLKNQSNKLEIIEEYGKNKKGKKRKGTDEIMADDFAVIESKSSFERKINREKREEECITYLLKLSSLRLYLFQGSDFNFENYPNKDLDLMEPSSKLEEDNDNNENNEFDFPDNQNNNEMNIDRNYFLKIIDPIKKDISKSKRKRKDERDYLNYILLNLIDMSFKIVDFSYFDFNIGKFFIDDNFQNSRYKKIISKKDFLIDNSKFLLCQIDLTKNDTKKKEKEKEKNSQIKEKTFMRMNVSIPSLDIFVDQLPLNFIIKLFYSTDNNKNEIKSKGSSSNKSEDKNKTNDKKSQEEKSSNNDDNNNIDLELNNMPSFNSWNECLEDQENNDQNTKEEDSLLIEDIFINSFRINFHYNSHKISFSKMYEKIDWIEILTSLSDIKEFDLKFKKFNKSVPTPMSDTISELINFWKDDILSNQVANSALRGLSFTRPFFKLYDGIKDLVKQPYISYMENRGIKRGIKKGMKNFLVSFSSQGILFGEKIFRGMKIVAFRKTKLSVKKKSLYKTWVYKINKKQQDYEMYYYK